MIVVSLFAEHRQHALRHGEAAEHVDRRERDARPPPASGSSSSGRAGRPSPRERRRDLHQRADGDDAADRVGHAHERRVQRGRHVPHHHVADEAGEHEHGEVAEERRRRVQRRSSRNSSAPTPNMIASVLRARHRRAAAPWPWPSAARDGGAGAALRGGAAGQLRRRRRPGDRAVLDHRRPRITSSSMLTLMTPSLVLHSSSVRRKQVGRVQRATTAWPAGSAGRCSR